MMRAISLHLAISRYISLHLPWRYHQLHDASEGHVGRALAQAQADVEVVGRLAEQQVAHVAAVHEQLRRQALGDMGRSLRRGEGWGRRARAEGAGAGDGDGGGGGGGKGEGRRLGLGQRRGRGRGQRAGAACAGA